MDIQDALDLINKSPSEMFKDDLEAAINEHWGEQVNRYVIEEEIVKGEFKFQEIECNIAHVIDTATGQYKNGEDWRSISFKELDHSVERGRFYKFNDNYWITTFTDEFNQITKDVVVRRCNNTLYYNDKSIPCIIDYEASSSNPLTSETLLTPNSNITIIVQGNQDTLAFDLNQKFMIGNSVKKRPYKIINYVDYLQNGIEDTSVPLVYMTLQLVQKSSDDEIEEKPKVESYIKIEPEITEILQGRTITLNASVWVDGVQVEQLITYVANGCPESNYELVEGDNEFTLTNLKQSSIPLTLTFTSGDLTKVMNINLRARF